jgi:hypothetical protein
MMTNNKATRTPEGSPAKCDVVFPKSLVSRQNEDPKREIQLLNRE